MHYQVLAAVLSLLPNLLGRFFNHASEAEKALPDARGSEKMEFVKDKILSDVSEIANPSLATRAVALVNPDDVSAIENARLIVANFQEAWPELVAIFSNVCALGKKAGIIKR